MAIPCGIHTLVCKHPGIESSRTGYRMPPRILKYVFPSKIMSGEVLIPISLVSVEMPTPLSLSLMHMSVFYFQ